MILFKTIHRSIKNYPKKSTFRTVEDLIRSVGRKQANNDALELKEVLPPVRPPSGRGARSPPPTVPQAAPRQICNRKRAAKGRASKRTLQPRRYQRVAIRMRFRSSYTHAHQQSRSLRWKGPKYRDRRNLRPPFRAGEPARRYFLPDIHDPPL
jgi:hypothetical protein